MAKNLGMTREAQTTVAVPVASGTKSGDVVLVGTAGLTGWALTDRATTATIATGAAAPGLADGEASVELTGVHTAVYLTVGATVAVGDKVYRVTADGTYNGTATSNVFIGYALQAITSGAVGLVGLAR